MVAPILAFIGMLLIGGASAWGFLLLGQSGDDGQPALALATLPPAASGDPVATQPPPTEEPDRSVAPVVVVGPAAERPDIKGTIVFSRAGDIWAASGVQLVKLTDTGDDTQPTWTHNGKYIYYIHTRKRTTNKSRPGGLYTLFVPEIWRMDADGRHKKRIYNGFIRGPGGQWFSTILQPDISPNGKTFALVSDGPNPNTHGEVDPVVLYLLDAKPNAKLRKVTNASSVGRLGHNDPEWSPDGKRIAYTRNRARGTVGMPTIVIYTCKSRKNCTSGRSRRLRPGYANPSWSPDGTWLAVEATRGLGRDIVIVNADRGDPRIQLTQDGNSFAPVVSPDGNQIAYLHRDGINIDLRVMTLDFDASGKITLVNDQAVTVDGAIDGQTTPAWYIPKSELTPRNTPAPTTQASAESSASAAPSP